MDEPRFKHPGVKTIALGMLTEALYVAALGIVGLIVSSLALRW
jgi:hypothetical protein